MLQRIQTLYLLVSLILTAIFLLTPIAYLANSSGASYFLMTNGLFKLEANLFHFIYGNKFLLIISIINLIITALAIFSYKTRSFQIKLCFVLILSYIVNFTTALIMLNNYKTAYSLTLVKLSWGLAMPLITIILTYLAFRAIKKDDELVKSADRIR